MKNLMQLLTAATLLAALSNLAAQNAPATPETAPPSVRPVPPIEAPVPASTPGARADENLKLNFRDVPLTAVLDYLSQAAGFIVVMDAEVTGTVTAWSHQPVTRDEAVELLNTVLFAKGFAVIRNGRTLMVVNREDARTRNIPVQAGNDPTMIPLSDVMVTQIIPVRTVSAAQLAETLQPLLGEQATLSVNEGSNALVMTDSQKNIRRIVQIIEALDKTVTSISTIRVFPLRYATAEETAEIITRVFESPNGSTSRSSRGGDRPDFRAIMMERFGGGDRGGDRGSDRGGRDRRRGNDSDNSVALQANSRVVAVPDERSNSVIVGAPEDTMAMVEQLIQEIDTNVTDPTEIRVFKLENADPVELAEVLNNLFETQTSQSSNRDRDRREFFFRGRGGDDRNRSSVQSDDKVTAVPDPRTTSLVVSAPRQLMPQIEEMVKQLDSSNAKRQRVFVYTLDHADVNRVSEMLRGMFEGENTRNTGTSTTRREDALSSRSGTFGQAGTSGTGVGGNPRGGGGTGGAFGR